MTDSVIRMPKLADTLVEGTVGQWLKQVGQEIRAGEPLASIETDKVTTELTSPTAGTLLELLVPEGQPVPIETPIARIGIPAAPDQSTQTRSLPASLEHVSGREEATGTDILEAEPKPKPTPMATRLLAEHGLTSADVTSSARRVTKGDVLRHVRSRDRSELQPLSSMRRAIAEHMQRARQTIPHGQTVMAADVTHLVEWRDHNKAEFQRQHGAPLTFTVLFVHALAQALNQPSNLGVAVALDNGLIVPVLRNASNLTLGEIARGIADLAGRARNKTLKPDETQGATMTVTNVGSFGNLTASPIIPLQQIGILGPGLVERRPMATHNGGLHVGWRCLLTLMFDRRALDDLAADRLLRGVVQQLKP